jgi:hypothetical protein
MATPRRWNSVGVIDHNTSNPPVAENVVSPYIISEALLNLTSKNIDGVLI